MEVVKKIPLATDWMTEVGWVFDHPTLLQILEKVEKLTSNDRIDLQDIEDILLALDNMGFISTNKEVL